MDPITPQTTGEPAVYGHFDPAYAPLARAFARNLATGGETGASVCVYVHGRCVADLWGGIADPSDGHPWQRDTVSVVFSCTKGATAALIHMLVARRVLDLDLPVAHWWPAFAANGKAGITLRMVLNHTAGLPALRAPMPRDCLLHPDLIARHLESEAPFWEPGTRLGYHAITFGQILAEVVRRATGQSLGTLFRDLIAAPLGLDFSIGNPGPAEARAAPIIPFTPSRSAPPTPFLQALTTPGTPTNLMLMNCGDWSWRGVNTPEGRAAEIPAASGLTNARGLAGLYAAIIAPDNPLGFRPGQIAAFARPEAETGACATLLAPMRFGPGFMLAMDHAALGPPAESLPIPEGAFGHVGMGGSVGYADPARGLAFAYTMNRLGGGFLLNTRGQSLLAALP